MNDRRYKICFMGDKKWTQTVKEVVKKATRVTDCMPKYKYKNNCSVRLSQTSLYKRADSQAREDQTLVLLPLTNNIQDSPVTSMGRDGYVPHSSSSSRAAVAFVHHRAKVLGVEMHAHRRKQYQKRWRTTAEITVVKYDEDWFIFHFPSRRPVTIITTSTYR